MFLCLPDHRLRWHMGLGAMPCNYCNYFGWGIFVHWLWCVSWMTVDSRLKSETTTAANMTSIIRLKAWNQCWVRRSSPGTRSMWPLWSWHRPPILLLPFWVLKMDIWKRYVFFLRMTNCLLKCWKLTSSDPLCSDRNCWCHLHLVIFQLGLIYCFPTLFMYSRYLGCLWY